LSFDLCGSVEYQGRTMRVSSAAVFCAFFVASSIAFAQTPATAATAAAPARVRLDPNSPAQAGRTALYKYLDDIAAKDEAERRAEIAKITTRVQAMVRQQQVRNTLLGLMGGGFEKTPLNAKVLGSTQMDGFRIEKVVFESQPQFYVTALLYLPDGVARSTLPVDRSGAATADTTKNVPRTTDNGVQKLPAIVIAPGHGATGKASDYTFASTFARNGFAVLSYDPIGQGERLQYPDPAHPGKTLATGPTGEHGEAGLQPTLIGDAVARYFVWDGMRAVDYLLTRPEIDAERIGAFGCSGGGVMTAMLGAADKRIKAIATACYLTTMDTLLPSIGPQDAEQSTPGFIAAGFDFADWVELAAPRPYAMVGTVSDMFPWAGFLATAQEARKFYALFDAKAAGTQTGKPLPPTPTGPTLNPDTANAIAADAPLQVIAGIGGHGNLRPLTSQIVSFFLVNLAHSDAAPILPPAPASGVSPFAAPNVPAALQVTPTGQVASSYPDSVTVHTLNLRRAAGKIPNFVAPQTLMQVQTDIREVTNAEAVPGHFKIPVAAGSSDLRGPDAHWRLPFVAGNPIDAEFYRAQQPKLLSMQIKSPPSRAILVLREDLSLEHQDQREIDTASLRAIADSGVMVLAVTPRPSPPGSEETKSPILGPFYLTELRAELVGKTLLGMRVDDVIRAVDYLASRPDVDPNNITARATGHMGLVLLHAAVLDPRIKHVTVDHVLESYDSLLKAPMPIDAPQDILPGVLLKYDIPDMVRVLGARLTATDWLPGTANLAGMAKP
jgi:cephalosporin-C deacetylase-like acetyl esterase